ncbi:MAG: hypothetical protein CMJ75_06895 [Planctomycetaceae bacterium]|nr:hypothetical protein [Planctomycetaceae bacterium]
MKTKVTGVGLVNHKSLLPHECRARKDAQTRRWVSDIEQVLRDHPLADCATGPRDFGVRAVEARIPPGLTEDESKERRVNHRAE